MVDHPALLFLDGHQRAEHRHARCGRAKATIEVTGVGSKIFDLATPRSLPLVYESAAAVANLCAALCHDPELPIPPCCRLVDDRLLVVTSRGLEVVRQWNCEPLRLQWFVGFTRRLELLR